MIIRRVFIAVVLAVASFCVAVGGLGRAYRAHLMPQDSPSEFSKIYHDGWIVDGAQIRLGNLLFRGNRLDLEFNPWRPEGMAPAHLRIEVCGTTVSDSVIRDRGPLRVYLRGDCDPREVTFHVLNPFVPSPTDTRVLGVQLVSARVSSALAIPLLELSQVMAVALSVWMLSLIALLFPVRVANLLAACAVPWIAFILLERAEMHSFRGLDISKLWPLWLLMSALGLGFALGARLEERRGGTELRSAERHRSLPLRPGGEWVLALGVMAMGGVLRFYGLNFGLPANFHPDEVPKINAIMRMVQNGNLDPQYFLHPSLLLYSTYFVNTLFHLNGTLATWIGALAGGGASGLGEWRETAYLAGRTVSALAGTLSILWTFFIGRRLFSSSVGLGASLLLAVMPLHVTCSRYLKEDSLLVCILLLTVLIVVKAAQEGRPRLLLLASFVAGCAASTKYSGLLAVGIVGAAPWIRSRDIRPDFQFTWWMIASLPLAPLAFLLCTPYALLNSEKFLTDFRSERNHMQRGHTTPVDAWSQLWTYHFSRSIKPGVSRFVGLLATVGVGILLWKRRFEGWFVVGLMMLFYLPAEYVKAKPAPQPERYILPCLPFLAVTAAATLETLWRSRARIVVPLLALGALIIPLTRTLELMSELRHDTRDEMAQWMVQHLPVGSRVLIDWKPYGPRFWKGEFGIEYPFRKTILEQLDAVELQAGENDYLVLSSLFFDRYFTEPNTPAALRRRFRDVFTQVPIVHQVVPEYGTYGFHNPRLTLFSLKDDDFHRLQRQLEEKEAGTREATDNDRYELIPDAANHLIYLGDAF